MTECPTECDFDCEDTCHEVHVVPYKRDHNPRSCLSVAESERERYEAWVDAVKPIHHYIADDGYGAMSVRTTDDVVDSAMKQSDKENERLREQKDMREAWALSAEEEIARLQEENSLNERDCEEAQDYAQKLTEENDQLRATVLDYENRITWFTTCENCARLLDSGYAETCRAETAEQENINLSHELALAWEELERHESGHHN